MFSANEHAEVFFAYIIRSIITSYSLMSVKPKLMNIPIINFIVNLVVVISSDSKNSQKDST